MRMMCVGKNSKVLKGLSQTERFKKDIVFHAVSLRENGFKYEYNNYTSILYLSGVTNTAVAQKDYGKLLQANCYDLCRFLINNMSKQDIPLLYLSSVKCNMCNNIDKYEYVADVIISDVKQNRSVSSETIQKFKKLFWDGYDCYAASKVIAEIILRRLYNNSIILRCDYIIGAEEEKNEIANLINEIIVNRDVDIPIKERGFVTYKDLSEIIYFFSSKELLINNEEFYDLYGKVHISGKELNKVISDFISIIHSRSRINMIEKGKTCVGSDNEKLEKLYYCNTGKKFVYIDIWDEIYQMFYRKFIVNKLQYDILGEYIGGSFAKVYKAQRGDLLYSIKIAYGEGADNGAEKLQNEARQLEAIGRYYSSEGIEPTLLPDQVKEVCSMPKFTYVISEWKHGELLFEKVNRGENVKSIIRNIIYEIDSCYRLRTVQCDKDLLALNRERIEYRIEMMKLLDRDLCSFFKSESLSINDNILLGPCQIVERLCNKYNNFTEKWGLCISGDAIFDNFIIEDEKMIKIFDPRGVDLLWETDGLPYFYPMYDWAKMIFYFLGWKVIREDLFELSSDTFLGWNYHYDKDDFKVSELLMLSKETYNVIEEMVSSREENSDIYMKQILFLVGMHFLCDAFPRLCGKGNSKKQCYAELLLGTIVLNVIDMNYDKESSLIWNEIVGTIQKMLLA